jgi:aspartate/methionine/tyrosine aminotransferase
MRIVEENEMYLVIDEGLWFEELLYPSSIQSDRVVRVVSLSKKYGLPGCKLGFMVAGEGFINNFYDYASTNYGGPLSVFFLLAEFIYQFEYILYSGTPLQDGLQVLSEQYDTSIIKLEHLYFDFIRSIQNNERKLSANRESLATWVHKHPKLIDKAFDFGGVNVFIKLRKNLKAYGLFLDLIQYSGVSILPSSCLGDETDSMIRITLLEKNTSFKKGLSSLKHLLRSYEAYDV